MRLQQVTVNGMVCNSIELKLGVPQRLELGSLLLNLYVTDRSNQIGEVSFKLDYGDDYLPYCSDCEPDNAFNRLQESRVKLENYLFLNQLDLNDSKTGFINLSPNVDKHIVHSKTISVGSSEIKKSKLCNNLGVTIDEQLRFQAETKTVLEKLAARATTIESTLPKFPTPVLPMLFHVHYLSPFEYSALFLL